MGSQSTAFVGHRSRLLLVLAVFSLCSETPGLSQSESAGGSGKPSLKLEGKAEFQQYTGIAAWQASQNYRQGVAALGVKDYAMAADFFKQAGSGFAVSDGAGKYLAEARFAEGQARRLLKQNAQAAKLFSEAVELFRKYDV